ncbi:helix-turn-helix domain-containing protein [Pseudomonas sp. YeP6b]|nr:helix-turn-helix domain-containing protein [Pseudomonas sp. YeP6b]
MMNKKKADQTANHNHSPCHSTSAFAQRARILERLREGPADTLSLRCDLSVLMPAPRVLELKQRGFDIETHRISTIDENGTVHHGVALYVLREVAK